MILVSFLVTKDENAEEQARNVIDDEQVVKEITGKDGNLPGGMSPELLKALSSDRYYIRSDFDTIYDTMYFYFPLCAS